MTNISARLHNMHILWKKGQQIEHIARPGWEIMPKYARKLFVGVALPRVLYGANIWYTPTPANETSTGKKKGMVKITTKLASMQRAGAIAITGGLRTSPTDTLDALANLIPIEQTIKKWCYQAALRLAALPVIMRGDTSLKTRR